jgi:hypothetical protein
METVAPLGLELTFSVPLAGSGLRVAATEVVWLETTEAVVEYAWYPDRLRTTL